MVSPTYACVLKRALDPREVHEALGGPASSDAEPGMDTPRTGWNAAQSALTRLD